jgi:hypothetical protein
MPPIEGLFAPVTPERLYSRRLDVILNPVARLYFLIEAQSYRGTSSFDLTNAMVENLGIGRGQKSKLLRVLEQRGLITVIRDGQTTVRVSSIE